MFICSPESTEQTALQGSTYTVQLCKNTCFLNLE
uniref:Uncharacterized protein n=1 Tax=Anguilla anguilla TaxID=7936 RepID=A0A0E9PVB3_ANGAN